MNTNYKSNNTSKWLRNCLTTVCLALFLLVGLPMAQAQSGNLPILFFSQRGGGLLRNFGINTDGSNPTLIGDPESQGFFARYSPDGQKILFVSSVPDSSSSFGVRFLLFLMNADGTNRMNILDDPLHHVNAPAWSPDGSKIAFVRYALDVTASELWIMNTDGSDQHLVYSNPGGFGAWYPSFSPDGSKIAFGDEYAGGDADIYVINADGTNLQQLTSNGAFYDEGPDWSPDGTKIIFDRSRNHGSDNGDIYVMNSDGTNQTRLTRGGKDDFYPIYSPDGSQIVFSRGKGSGFNIDIYIMNADGRNVIRLTHERGWDSASDWGP